MKRKLLLVILASIFLPLFLVGGVFYVNTYDAIKESKIDSVSKVASEKHRQLVSRLKRTNESVGAILAEITDECPGAPQGLDLACAKGHLQMFSQLEHARRISLFSLQGNAPASSLVVHKDDTDLLDANDDLKAVRDMKPGQLAEFSSHPASNVREYYITAQDKDNKLKLIVAFSADVLQDIFNTGTDDLGSSGESFLVDADGFFITKARYPSIQGRTVSISTLPMQVCLHTGNGKALDVDYRNVSIIHGFRFVPEIGGGCIMAHIDQVEAFADLKMVGWYAAVYAMIVLLVSMMASAVIGKRIAAPIITLSSVAKEIANGKRGVSFAIKVTGSDEVSELARSFNKMMARLQATLDALETNNQALEGKVRERTEELVRSNRIFRELFENMTSGVAIYSALEDGEDFVFANLNRASERIENIRRADVIGRSVLEAFPGIRDFGLFDVFQRVWKTGVPESFPVSFYHDERRSGWRENFVCKLPTNELIAIYDDITDSKNLENELECLAHTDYLTNLCNRHHFMEQGRTAYSRAMRHETPLSVLMFDIDHFKRVNDGCGHSAGDLAIRKVADAAFRAVRGIDIIGRIGGEEFAVVLPDTEKEDALLVAERIRCDIEKTEIVSDGITFGVTVSIGVVSLCREFMLDKKCAMCKEHTTLEKLLQMADKALYVAKNNGRNCVRSSECYLARCVSEIPLCSKDE